MSTPGSGRPGPGLIGTGLSGTGPTGIGPTGIGSTGTGLTGTVLEGRYRVGARIARGGMSTVYRGVDLRLSRPVAIKVMESSFAADPTFLTRFEREARLAAGLTHPGVVAVYDQGRDADVVFLVMELVDGGTLRDLMRQSGALPVAATMSILEPLLSALGAAHAGGLVHRDVKPENVLISARGEVKVADFGLVRAVTSQTMATRDLILGTVAYLSPEQVATGAADARSDVYAAGIVAYEMLTGQTPYGGDNAISVAYQHVHSDVPPVTDLAPGVPVELDDLILAATRRDPMARPRDASAFLSALVATRSRLGLVRTPVPVPRMAAHPADGGHPSPSAGRPARSTGSAAQTRTAVRPAGPGGTAVVGGVRPATVHLPPAPPGPRVPPVRRKTSRLRLRLVVVLLVVLLAVAAAAGGWWLGSGRWAYSPAAVGVDRQSAETLVREAGLVPHISVEPSNTVLPGTVADTRPVPGSKLLKGSDVELVVSTGRPLVPRVPPGTSVAEASKLVSAAHLTPRVALDADRYDSSVPAGAVVTTDPASATALAIAAPVRLIRSKGSPLRTVPEVAGKSVEDARNKLLVAGFATAPDKLTFDPVGADGAVLGTDPQPGLQAPQGSAVALLIADSLTVPDVRGETNDQATTDLQRSGFAVVVGPATYDSDVDGDSAVGTSPAAGSKVDPDVNDIVLTLSDAVTVPDVTRGDVGAARSQLDTLGLVLSVSAMFGSSGASVIDQVPGAGSRVQPGSTVIVSAFP